MDWKDKMRSGMKLIHDACVDEQSMSCDDCPFDKICDILLEAYWNDISKISTPDSWNI